MKIMTGKTGTPHVTSQQFRQLVEGTVGQDSYILTSGENLEPELQTNNLLKIRSGMMSHHGNLSIVDIGTYDEVTIANGTQGMQRIDLVVNRYTRNESSGIEENAWVVIQGTPAASDPQVPAYTEGNLQEGDLVDDCPVFEVHLNGINVTEVVKLLEVSPDIPTLNASLSYLNGKMDSKNFLRENDYEMTYLTIHTSYDDRVEALKNSLVNNSSLWKQGLTAAYIVSDPSDDRGMAIVMKKVNPDGALRLAFQYWDYWGENEFWTYTNAGWEQR